jgi:hypothetical protein
MHCASLAFWGAGILALGTAGCMSERDDVAPTILSIALATQQGAHSVTGEVRVGYENRGEESYVIERPELQLVRADGAVSGIDLTFPAGFVASFASGDAREATFAVADSTGWTGWCGQTVEAEMHHRGVASDGTLSTSFGAAVPVAIACQP